MRTRLSLSRNHPGGTRDNLCAPEPRAAVETFLDVFSKPSLTWADLPRLRRMTSLPVVLKGVLHPDDARRAVDARGSTGSSCRTTAAGRSTGRWRRSTRCRAWSTPCGRRVRAAGASSTAACGRGPTCSWRSRSGADAVGIGRPHVYGLALAGEEGVAEVLRNIRAELDLTMALTGCRTLADVTRDRLVRRPTAPCPSRHPPPPRTFSSRVPFPCEPEGCPSGTWRPASTGTEAPRRQADAPVPLAAL